MSNQVEVEVEVVALNTLNRRHTMAKKEEETTEAATEAAADSRLIMIDVPAGHASGLEGRQPRNAVIRALASTGEWTRGDIAKEITKLQYPDGSKKVPYQIVFQATKNIDNVKMAQRGSPSEGESETTDGETTDAGE